MSLDAPKSDAELLALLAARTHDRGTELGPATTTTRTTRARQRTALRSEHDEQVLYFRWIDETVRVHPDLARAFAVPNGGYRHIATAMKLKAEGVKPGIPDIMLLVARDVYHGLMIEMKRPGGTLSPMQADWHCAFTQDGFRVVIATTWESARDHTLAYLAMAQ